MISNDAYYSHEGGDGGMDSIGTGRRGGDESLHEPTRLCPFRPHLGIHNAGRCLRSRFPPRIPQLAIITAEQPSICAGRQVSLPSDGIITICLRNIGSRLLAHQTACRPIMYRTLLSHCNFVFKKVIKIINQKGK